ncbi:MAG: hypothetical protein IPK83_08680 [Planctomycetes bacterium]|nr:hypothetical protein [Planctomycetota bacterium]
MAMTRSRRATTIIEIVMAIIILAVSVPPLMSAFSQSALNTIHPANAATAAFLATERMEEIVARRYRATDGYAAVTTANFPNESSITNFARFSRTVSVSFVNASLASVGSDQGYKLVRVTVSWNSGAKSVVVERVFANF